ncbi:hypothetical protein LPJ61_004499 [Coemansia biformis]|uniref:B30.2/SPRY domain-containing protein n=1 Tax=Coemansia biformis TaxID=1286918 RepID=A0A9W8CVA0_9FUNG|nr:hypothetical protein LPJ61_004499 [Coemansia biformis]
MAQLLDMGAVGVIAACVRQDDQGVSSWGIGLLHEFVSRGVGRSELGASPGIVRWLCRKLSTAKYAYTNQLILRSLWSLCTSSRAALDDATQPASLRRILSIFAVEDDADAHHWGIALVAKLSIRPATHRWILDSPLPHTLGSMITRLPQNLRTSLLPEVASIITRLCHSISLAPQLSAHPEIAHACRLLMESNVETAHLATIIAIINATATSRAFLRLVVDDDIRQQLLHMLSDFSRDTAQNYASKGLVALLACGLAAPSDVVFHGLLPFLRRTAANFRVALAPYLAPATSQPALPAPWAFDSISRHVNITGVLLTALRVFLATEERDAAHFLAAGRTEDAVAALFDYQECLLAHLALCLAQVTDTATVVRDIERGAAADESTARDRSSATLLVRARAGVPPPGGGSCMRLAVCAFVGTYHWGHRDDLHFEAALDECRALLSTTRRHLLRPAAAAATARGQWQEAASRRRHSQGSGHRKSAAFDGDLRGPRLRCVLPAIYAMLGALADSLEPGLVVQSPAVVRQTVWLVRIICHEFPDARAITMRVLSSIDTRGLCAADAAGLTRLCSAYLVDTALGSSTKPPIGVDINSLRAGVHDVEVVARRLSPAAAAQSRASVEEQHAPLVEPDAKDEAGLDPEPGWREWLAALPACVGAASEADMTPQEYFRRYAELKPSTLVQPGRFFAQFALDRHVAGWWTCEEIYSCVESPGTADQGASCWLIDRSGPRGAGRQSPATIEHVADSLGEESGSGEARTATDAILMPSSIAAFARAPRAAQASGSSAVSSTHLPRTRPPSPFPAQADAHPEVAAGRHSPTVAGPRTLLSSAPRVRYRNHAPYYPAFAVLADGCTVWNASWRFESARMCTGVDGRLGGVHRFHVRLLTSGLIQVGWCSNLCGFYPESGEGVGDDYESVAYDGYRQRRWYGTAEDKTYGERWQAGDIITSELDLDNDRVVFYRNGRSLGLAFGLSERGDMEGGESGFQGLSRDRTWYPAFSFSSHQGLVFLGSDDGDQQRDSALALPACISASSRSTSASSIDDMSIRLLERQCERTTASAADSSGASGDIAGTSDASLTVHPQKSISECAGTLRQLGVVSALRIRFEFQDLDAFPCFALALPAGRGRVTVGPVTDPENLATYLQPRWWAVWTTEAPGHARALDVRGTPALELQKWFAGCVGGDEGVRGRALLTDSMASSSWLYFIVLADGRLCLVVVGDEPARSAPLVAFDIGAGTLAEHARGHIWLPTASPAITSIDLVPISP